MADPNIYPTYRDSFVNPNLPNVSYVGQDTQSAFETMPDNRARRKQRFEDGVRSVGHYYDEYGMPIMQPPPTWGSEIAGKTDSLKRALVQKQQPPRPDTPGWTPPDGIATQAQEEWYNKKTGERHTTNTGGWTPPSYDWVKQGQPGYVRIPEFSPPPPIQPPDIPPNNTVTPLSPYEGYTSDEIRGFVDRSLGSILGESGLGQSFKVDTGDNYRTVDWEDKGFTAPENPPDDIPQIFWNTETKEIVQVPSGGFSPPEGWISYSGQYIDRIDVPDFGDEPDKIVRDLYTKEVDFGSEEGGTDTYRAWFEKERLTPEWAKWKQSLDEFEASLPDVSEDTPEVPRGPTYNLVFDRGAVTPDKTGSIGNQIFQMLKDSGKEMRWNPESKKIMVDNREIHGIEDLKDLYKENLVNTGRTLNVTQGMQAIDFYKNNLLNASATGYYDLTYTKRALKSIEPDTSYLDAIIHNDKLRNDKSYGDTIQGNVSDAVLLTREYIDSLRNQIPTYSTATPRSWEKEIGPAPKTPEEIEEEWQSTNVDGD